MNKLIYAFVLVTVLLTIGTIFFHYNESWSYVDAFYFSAVTITTVGYGDLVPARDSTKIFISVYAIFSIGIMLYVLGSVISKHVEEQEKIFHKLFLKIYDLRPSTGLMNRKRLNRAIVKSLKRKNNWGKEAN